MVVEVDGSSSCHFFAKAFCIVRPAIEDVSVERFVKSRIKSVSELGTRWASRGGEEVYLCYHL